MRRSTCAICRRRTLSADGEREVEEEDLETSYYRDDQIDLNELLREQFYLALPMKPLCREDCTGLCPQCGTNLNTGTCACAPQWEDPRLAPLRETDEDRRLTRHMPNPKRRHSKTRTAKRRTHDALRAPTTGLCPQCHEPKAPHRICPHCGYYRQRQVRPVDEE